MAKSRKKKQKQSKKITQNGLKIKAGPQATAKQTTSKQSPPKQPAPSKELHIAAPPVPPVPTSNAVPHINQSLRAKAVREHLEQTINNLKKDLDPAKVEKLKNLKKDFLKTLKIGSAYLGGIFALSVILIILDLHSSGRIAPRTQIGKAQIGYIAMDQAKQKVTEEIRTFNNTPIVFSLNAKRIAVTPLELGISINPGKTFNSLPLLTFEKQNILTLPFAAVTSRQIAVAHYTNLTKAIEILDQKTGLTNQRAKNAQLVLKDKNYEIIPEANGKTINSQKLLADLENNINNLSSQPIELQIQAETPAITAQELARQKDRLVGLLQNVITLNSPKEKMSFKLADHLDALELTRATEPDGKSQGAAQIQLKINQDKFEPFLVQGLLKDLEIATEGVDMSKDEKGKIVIVGKGQDGQSVPRKNLYESINLAANTKIDKVEVPIVIEKAPLKISDDLQQLGIKEHLSTGYTTYFGSPANRMHNINVGIARFNGLLIKPGEEFSFNKNLGQVDKSTGYKMEKVIKKNKAEYEYGGGICQVSTTMYRAALFAGLDITERHGHTWKVSYYGQVLGHGLDATIYLGGADLKFTNNTPSNILIQSYTDGPRAYFKLYGTGDGRTIKMEGPMGGGMNYKWIRHIFDKDNKEITTENINTHYIPMPIPTPAADQAAGSNNKPAVPVTSTPPPAPAKPN